MIASSLGSPRLERRAPSFSTRLRSLRAFSLPCSILPVVLATAAATRPRVWKWDVLLVSMLGVAALHVAANLLNDVFDFRSGVDRRVEGDEGRPGRVIILGMMTAGQVLAEVAVALAFAALAAAYIWWRSGPAPLAFAAGGLVLLYTYTAPPLALKYRGLGEPAIFLAFGPFLLVGAAWAQVGHFSLPALLLSVPIGCATTAVVVGNNLRDRQEDAEASIITTGQMAGGRVAQIVYVSVVLIGGLSPAVMAIVGQGPLGLLASPVALAAAVKPLAAVCRGRRVPDIDSQTAKYMTVLSVIVLAAYLLSYLW